MTRTFNRRVVAVAVGVLLVLGVATPAASASTEPPAPPPAATTASPGNPAEAVTLGGDPMQTADSEPTAEPRPPLDEEDPSPVTPGEPDGISSSDLLDGSNPNSTTRQLHKNPWGCQAFVASPHPSGSNIRVHGRINCARPAPAGSASVSLYNSRWFGWGLLDKPMPYTHLNARTYDTQANWKPFGACHYYRGIGHFSVGGGRYTTPVLNNYDQRYLKKLPAGCGTRW